MTLNRHGILILPSRKGKLTSKSNPKARTKKSNKEDRKAIPCISKQAWVFDAFAGQCHYCGLNLMSFKEARKNNDRSKRRPTLDHKIPRAKGGTSERENLILACVPCNSRKGDRPYEFFVAALETGEELP